MTPAEQSKLIAVILKTEVPGSYRRQHLQMMIKQYQTYHADKLDAYLNALYEYVTADYANEFKEEGVWFNRSFPYVTSKVEGRNINA